MPPYRITSELFTLPYKDGLSILYAPLVGFVGAVNGSCIDLLGHIETLDEEALTPEQMAVVSYLTEKGVFNGPPRATARPDRGLFSPSKLTLFPTSQCNLRCRYCYAFSEGWVARTMDWNTAVSAVEYFIKVLKRDRKTDFCLEFHGGGEPLFASNLVTGIVIFAEERCAKEGLSLNVCAATNGVLSEQMRAWVVQHFASLIVSFDVLPRVQHIHRAALNRVNSFDSVDRTLKYFDQHNFTYGIRCAVSRFNVDALEETVDFVTEHYNTHLLVIEPVTDSGYGSAQAAGMQPDMHKFVEQFKRLEPICAERGLRLAYSGALLEKISSTFCYVGTDDFAVTPDGFLTNCWQVTSNDHPLAKTFIFGRILSDGEITIDEDKLDYLRTFTVDHLDCCSDCFAKWHCAGGCAANLAHGDYHGSRDPVFCETTRQLMAHRITQMLEREHYYQPEAVGSTD